MKRVSWRLATVIVVVCVLGLGIGASATNPTIRKQFDRLRHARMPWSHHDVGEVSHEQLAPVQQSRVVGRTDDGWCSSHNRPEAECALCAKKPDHSGSRACLVTLPTLQLAKASTARTIGLEYAEASSRLHVDRLVGNAEITYATHSYAEVRPRVTGRITEVLAEEGETIQRGEVLLIVDSADVGTAKATFLGARPIADLAQVTFNRVESLVQSNAAAQKDVLEAKAALNKASADLLNATQRLLNLGYSKAELETIYKSKDTSSELRVLAPMTGVLVMRHAVVGEAVEPTTIVFSIADTSQMWCWIDVYENEIGEVRVGQDVNFRIAGIKEPVYKGKVELIDFEVNATTRTVRVRATLNNADLGLRSNQFGTGVIELNKPHVMVVVPTEAVQLYEGTPVVFLPQSENVFRPQRIVTKPCDEPGMTEVAWGLKPGEKVVTIGSFLLYSELIKHLQPE